MGKRKSTMQSMENFFINKKINENENENENEKSEESEFLDESEELSETNDPEYFEYDFSKIKETILQHLVKEVGKNKKMKIDKGLTNAFNLFSELEKDFFHNLAEAKPNSSFWKIGLSPDEIKRLEPQILELRKKIDEKASRISIKNIIDSKLTEKDKCIALQAFDTLQNTEPFTEEYFALENEIDLILKLGEKMESKQNELESEAEKMNEMIKNNISLKTRILSSNLPELAKSRVWEKYKLYENIDKDSVTACHYKEWIDNVLLLPFDEPPKIEEKHDTILLKLKNELDKEVYGMNHVKEKILCIFNEKLKQNSAGSTIAIGMIGSPGCGKTKLARTIGKALNRKWEQISLGGTIDSSIIKGQSPGWVGSSPGRIVKGMQKMKTRYGVYILDEIDKLGQTPHGKETQYSLLEIIDPTQNETFCDNYIGPEIPLNLTSNIFIYCLNSIEGLDPALLSRLQPLIYVPDYTFDDKYQIIINHSLPEFLLNKGMKKDDVIINKNELKYLISKVNSIHGPEGGVRNLRNCLDVIISKINLLISLENLENFKLTFSKKLSLPLVLDNNLIDLLLQDTGSENKKDAMTYFM